MAETYTSNLELVKPDYDSPADIFVINSNMDKIDNAVANAGKVKSVNGKTGEVDLTASDVGALPAGSTAKNSAKLGGKAPEYYIQPRNLLDNSNFEIAQAGYGGMHGATRYVCDMWYNLFGFGEFSFDKSNGLTMAYKDNHAYACQKIENNDLYVGKPLTFAVCLSDGTVHVCSGVYTKTTITAVKDSGTWLIDIHEGEVRIIVVEGSVTIKWAALYEGAFTAETLPPYVPKGYAAELAECQRYYWKTDMIFRSSANAVLQTINIQFPIRMRVIPTVKYSLVEGSEPSGFNISVDGVSYYSAVIFIFNMYEAMADL